jgi:hypothetical protein
VLTFRDGPLAGKSVLCRRAPVYLRAVIAPDGQVDALDQLGDEPDAGEVLHAYVRIGAAGNLHVDGTDRQGRRFGRWYASGEYRLCDPQPDDATMRDRDAWRQWCLDRQAERRAAPLLVELPDEAVAARPGRTRASQ